MIATASLSASNPTWYGAEVLIFRKEEYEGRGVVYDCPRTCEVQGLLFSCDWFDYAVGTDPFTCDANGEALAAEPHNCDCSGCACSDWDPPPSSYVYRFTLEDALI